jgi:hypothetical protein
MLSVLLSYKYYGLRKQYMIAIIELLKLTTNPMNTYTSYVSILVVFFESYIGILFIVHLYLNNIFIISGLRFNVFDFSET